MNALELLTIDHRKVLYPPEDEAKFYAKVRNDHFASP